ncbi:hypothetical protein CDA63_19045 [Hymenobacter amundsenii]|uniref:Uncharacterized protein n=1 Tax=Hymenobacter amundsenii TaxID=2006685 RepID=A0A246FG45_9BACT|nr:hypothetical protein CDA63_19045 [Hymenobacter amundsenii]
MQLRQYRNLVALLLPVLDQFDQDIEGVATALTRLRRNTSSQKVGVLSDSLIDFSDWVIRQGKEDIPPNSILFHYTILNIYH